ncbi:hypothetical protein GPECTOR_7g1280 [Gonium pectorale]|uniref:Uncharacterized protein n=1 Tax=Gonium pectorale TaxID=33097 RepID=A0A150GUB8_GONPE|nr:hypothetical protein GPECTOR_7g1280 [Gonium pectorale]|eukprot:KXZ53384.1 hypothetical protein GPECTOR_7g1280 [Gonium pectorale]
MIACTLALDMTGDAVVDGPMRADETSWSRGVGTPVRSSPPFSRGDSVAADTPAMSDGAMMMDCGGRSDVPYDNPCWVLESSWRPPAESSPNRRRLSSPSRRSPPRVCGCRLWYREEAPAFLREIWRRV